VIEQSLHDLGALRRFHQFQWAVALQTHGFLAQPLEGGFSGAKNFFSCAAGGSR